MKTLETLESETAGFTGTAGYHKLSICGKLVATDGVAFLCKEFGAYWLFDMIAGYTTNFPDEEFQVWWLVRNHKGTDAILRLEDGNNNTVFKKRIPFTDFPFEEAKIWVVNGVAMLPSEY